MYSNGIKKNILKIDGWTINKLLLIISVVISITPVLSNNINKIIWGTVIVLWYFDSIIIRKREKGFKGIYFFCGLVLWLLYDIFLLLIGHSDAKIGNYFILMTFYDMLIKALYIQQYYSSESKEQVKKIVKLVIFINVVQNVCLGINTPGIHETSIFYYNETYKWKNIGATEFYNMLPFYISFCYYSVITANSNKEKIINYIQIAVTLIFLVTCSPRLNALLMTMLLFVLVYLKVKRGSAKKMIFVCTGILIFFVCIVCFQKQLLSILPDRVAVRLEALLTINDSAASNNIYLGRIDLALTSLRTWVNDGKSFLVGVGFHIGEEYYGVIGQHSIVTDYFARYGFVGFLFIIVFFISLHKMIINCQSDVLCLRYKKTIMICFIIASIISNSFRPEEAVSAFVLSALICDDYLELGLEGIS